MADSGSVTHGHILSMGVLDVPYRSLDLKNGRRVKGAPLAITTGDVAQILEDKYHIFETFYKVHQKDFVNAIESSLEGALETLMMGRVVDPWGEGMQDLQKKFRNFINSKEAERYIRGAPTQAALNGVSHRRAHPYAKSNPRRPSFRDTGLYVGSARFWMSG